MLKKLFKWAGIVVIGLIVIGIFVDGKEESSGAATVAVDKPEEPPVEVSPNALLKAYKDNEVAANQMYKGKRLLLNARVASIEAGIGDEPYLVLAAGGDFEFNRPQARLAKGEENVAASLKKGQTINLLCIGNSEVGGTPMLKDCRVQS